MLCPNCSEHLEVVELSNQKILHCKNCGSNFFEANGINRITAGDAEQLTKEANTSIVMGTPKVCPRDTIFLHLIENDEAVPHNVSLFKCPKCQGVFAYPDDLVKFKKAQGIKLEFFKIWENPLPALRTVLVFSFLVVLSLTVLSNLTNRSLQSTQAENIVGHVSFTHEGRYLFVNFTTDTEYLTSILIHDKTDNTTVINPISTVPAKLHYATLTNVNPQHEVFYQIIISDGKGTDSRTDEAQITF